MSREIKVALLAIVAVCLLYFGYFFLKGRNIFSTEQFFTSVFNNVDLLVAGDQVLVNGYQVGKVYSTAFDPTSGKITVEFTVAEEVKLPKGTKTVIYSADMLGDKAMKLVWPTTITTFHEPGDVIPGEVEKAMTDMLAEEMLPIKDQVATLMNSVDTIMRNVNGLLATKQLDSTLHSLNIITSNLASASNGIDKKINAMSQQLQGIMNDFEQLSGNLNNSLASNQANIDEILNNANTLSKDFTELSAKLNQLEVNETLQTVETTLQNANIAVLEATTLLNGLNNGDGTAGAVLKDRKVYDNLDKVTADLDALLVDFKANPKRYVHFTLIDRTAKIEAKEKRREERKARKEAKN